MTSKGAGEGEGHSDGEGARGEIAWLALHIGGQRELLGALEFFRS